MIIANITISNYRGIAQAQTIPLNRFSSFVGKNDAGKSIVLNEIASFLDPKNNPVTITDFNDSEKSIEIECRFISENIRDAVESKVKTKIKKADGLDEFLDDILTDDQLIIQNIDSDKHQNNYQKQITRAERFRTNKDKGSSYVIKKSCLENYYHPRAFERAYGLVAGSFPDIADDDNARSVIQEYRANNAAPTNIKEKNNFDVFSEMTKDEWEAVVEQELIGFLRRIVNIP